MNTANFAYITKILRVLFPTARAYVNFFLIWIFLMVLATNRDQVIYLISGLGALYCLNEWAEARHM